MRHVKRWIRSGQKCIHVGLMHNSRIWKRVLVTGYTSEGLRVSFFSPSSWMVWCAVQAKTSRWPCNIAPTRPGVTSIASWNSSSYFLEPSWSVNKKKIHYAYFPPFISILFSLLFFIHILNIIYTQNIK